MLSSRRSLLPGGEAPLARYVDGTVTVGLTDVAQNMAKTIVSVTSKGADKSIKWGKSLVTVESDKWDGSGSKPNRRGADRGQLSPVIISVTS